MGCEAAVPARRQRLGEILRFLGVVSDDDLARALGRQCDEGGRLGSCLLDSGSIDEETLLAALGAQQGTETVDAKRLREVGTGLSVLLPARAAVLAGAVPIAHHGATLEVAMTEPTDIARLDDLARVTRLRIVPKLGLELRIAEALERLYDLSISERLARLRRKLAQRSEVRGRDLDPPAGTGREEILSAV